MLILISLDSHDLSNDLCIRFAIEAMILWTGRTIDLDERAMDRALSGAGRQQNRSVDVEENELHIRVNMSPLMMQAAPMPCHNVGFSPSKSHATRIAITGCKFEYIAVRVGPRTRTP